MLVCGPSNISVDNIVERLALTSPGTPIVRLGHPARLLPSVVNHSLEALTQTSDAAGIVSDVRKEMDEKQASIRKTRNGRERRVIYADLKRLRKEYREREGRCIDDLMKGSKVVLSTLHGAGGHQVRNQEFDVVVIDEASQALEPQCWIPLVFGGTNVKKLILAGDHLQLPPTVKSANDRDGKDEKKANMKMLEQDLAKLTVKDDELRTARDWSLETTMFDRLLATHGSGIKKLLNTQYRMQEKIMRFPSDELYEGKLVAADAVKARLLKDLPYGVKDTEDTTEPLVFFDTQGGDFPEKTEDDSNGEVHKSTLFGDSKNNEMEAAVVAMHVKNLIQAGVRDEDIAVVTPYNAQLALLSSMLKEKYPNIELGSIDGFQGREKEAVVVSLVRSNAEREVGFLGEKRRLNGKFNPQYWPRLHFVYFCFSDGVGQWQVRRHYSLKPEDLTMVNSCHDTTEAAFVRNWGFRDSCSRQSLSTEMDDIPRGEQRPAISKPRGLGGRISSVGSPWCSLTTFRGLLERRDDCTVMPCTGGTFTRCRV